MKKSFFIFFAGLLFVLGTQINTAAAQQKGQIAVGAILIDPNGLSIKGWIEPDIAIDGALSFNLYEDFSTIYLHSDILFHSNKTDATFGLDSSTIDVYYGAGLRFLFNDNADDIAGIRFPGGLDYHFEGTPLVTFFEIAPVLDFAPDARLSFEGAIGARFYLN